MNSSICGVFDERDFHSRYVAETLTPADVETFERHMIGCSQCQQAVRMSAGIRAQLRRGEPRKPSRPSGSGIPFFTSIAIAAAIMLVAGMQLLNESRVRHLGLLREAPGYAGIAVRSAPPSGDSAFTEAMRLYLKGDFDAARRMLKEAQRTTRDSVPSSFFIGAIDLMRGNGVPALQQFGVVIRRGDSPYLAEAHYYAAKAWLLGGRADSAVVHLVHASVEGSHVTAAARALRDSISAAARTQP